MQLQIMAILISTTLVSGLANTYDWSRFAGHLRHADVRALVPVNVWGKAELVAVVEANSTGDNRPARNPASVPFYRARGSEVRLTASPSGR
jgi:hypothetical protein